MSESYGRENCDCLYKENTYCSLCDSPKDEVLDYDDEYEEDYCDCMFCQPELYKDCPDCNGLGVDDNGFCTVCDGTGLGDKKEE